MNVLSLFDGMSCGRIALDRLGIKVDNYYSSEIDKYAMKVSEANYPDIIQIGDVTKMNYEELPQIDLIMGGSPCQGFSFAGKQLAFDDPRSALFFCFWRAVKHLKPKYFLLENVRMKKEYLDVISEYMGVEPIMINSALVSAQNRVRYYWTNIPGIEQPEDRGMVLKDILENDAEEPMYSNIYGGFGEKKPREHFNKSVTIRANSGGGAIPNVKLKDFELSDKAIDYMNRSSDKWSGGKTRKDIYIKHESEKGMCLTANMHKGVPYGVIAVDKPKIVAGAFRGRYYKDGVRQDQFGSVAGKTKQMLELRKDEKTNTVTTVQKDNVLTKDNVYWRKLTPVECERLQTVPDNYTNHVSNTQRYKMLGNGWTIETIAHILKNMETKQ